MYQTIYETATNQEFSPFALKQATAEFQSMNFGPEELLRTTATYRSDERYVSFEIEGHQLFVRLGIGSHRGEEAAFNSIRLDELVNFNFGRLQRGCHSATEQSLQDCIANAVKDLKEFAYEFLGGDFRPFLRTLAMYHREQKAAQKAADQVPKTQIFLA